jgi:predicted transcriptional regulator
MIMVNIKMDPKMRDALKGIAEKQFSSVSSVIKQAVEQYLQGQGIDWRAEKKKSPKNQK